MHPILYSFRRCPYAIRARMALCQSRTAVELREVVLKNKPASLLEFSPKGTVPVLVIGNRIIEESLEVMRWALQQNDPQNWLRDDESHDVIFGLIEQNDQEFKPMLDAYKYSDRYPESEEHYFAKCQNILQQWDDLLVKNRFLLDEKPCLADAALFPFVRQFAFVNKNAFDDLPFSHLQKWLQYWLESQIFNAIMPKIKPWEEGDLVIFKPFENF